jgi:ubiquinone/menaquinone biosynthesis C-methylase UbiE
MPGQPELVKRSDPHYLNHAAASVQGRAYKEQMTEALDLDAGHVVADIGCGTGVDLAAMADRVGSSGTVIGVDADETMIAESHRRSSANSVISVRYGDAHALPLPDTSVDRVRMERVAQHLLDPAAAFAEVYRVTRPGGLFVVADPDWDTLVIDDLDVATSRAYTRFVTTRVVRNGPIGHQLPRLATDAGFAVTSVTAIPVLFTDRGAGEEILGIERVTGRAVKAGVITAEAAQLWLDRLAHNTFTAAFTFFMVVARKPGQVAGQT